MSVADVLKVGLERSSPSVEEAFNKGFMSALAEVYDVVCDSCDDEVMAIARGVDSEPSK